MEKNQSYNIKKIDLYKKGIIKFIKTQIKNNICKILNIDKINSLDFIIGILFLTEMNRYCKMNNISIHGYYIAYSLIYFFIELKQKMIYNKEIKTNIILDLFNNLSNNIEYLNFRIDNTNPFKKKINENFTNLILVIVPLLNDIINYYKNHQINQEFKSNKYVILSLNLDVTNNKLINNLDNLDNLDKLNNKIIGCCNNNCYICWVDNILTKFFYILLLIAKFMGTGITKDPNLYKLSEYYSNIFYTIIKLDNILSNIPDNHNNQYNYQNMFDNYIDYKNKLLSSIIELDMKSETIDEIINYLDNNIMNKFKLLFLL